MLQVMRDNAQGMVAKVIVFFIVIVFTLWGVESIVNLSTHSGSQYSVDGEEISPSSIQRLARQQKDNLKAQLGQNFNQDIFNDQVFFQAAANDLINQAVAVAGAKKLGMAASPQEIDENILATPSFQVDGSFNKEKFKDLLGMNGWSVRSFKNDVAKEVILQQMQSGLALSNKPLAFQDSIAQALLDETRDIRIASFDVAKLKQSIDLSEQDLLSYYDSYKDSYKTPVKQRIEYVELSRSDIGKTLSVSQDELESAYKAYEQEQQAKEQRQLRHLLLEVSDERDEAATKALAETLYAQVKEGKAFSDLIQKYSDDAASKKDGGDLGLLSKGELDDTFLDAAFLLEKNQVSQPVKTQFGYHLVEVTRVVKPQIASFAQQKSALEKQLRAEKTELIYAEKLQELENSAFSAGTITELAEIMGLEAQTSALFTRVKGDGVTANNEVRTTAFQENYALDHEISKPIELSDSAVVFAVSERIDSVIKPFADVKGQVSDALKSVRAKEQALAKAKALSENTQQGSWDAKTVSLTEQGMKPSVLKAVFELGVDKPKVVEYAGGVAVVLVDKINAPSWLDTEPKGQTREQVARELVRLDIVNYQQWAASEIDVERPADSK